MDSSLSRSLQLTLAHEGGYVNHPKDPGGATNKGVTQRVYDAYRISKGLRTHSVRNIRPEEYEEIYVRDYWVKSGADRLPVGVDYATFDYAVNSGVRRAVKDLQRTINDFAADKLYIDKGITPLAVDGITGAATIAAACACADADEVEFIERYCRRRMAFLRSLKTFPTFGRGWTRRVFGDLPNPNADDNDHGVIDYAVRMAKNDLAYPIPPAVLPTPIGNKPGEASGKGEEADRAITKTKEGVGATLATLGVSGNTVIAAAQEVQPHVGDSLFGKLALAAFVLLMLAGVGLMVWNFFEKRRELSGA